MKRLFIALGIFAVLLCSCMVDGGTEPRYNADNAKKYTWEMFIYNVIVPAEKINSLMLLDEYIAASEEERMSDDFSWHRENISIEEDNVFHIENIGKVKTHGKRFRDADPCWEVGYEGATEYVRAGEDSWTFTGHEYIKGINTTVTYIGKNDAGKNTFNVKAYLTDKAPVSRFSDKVVNAVIFTQEGGITIINPLPHGSVYEMHTAPEGSGVFRIETEADGEPMDWMELYYRNSQKGTVLVFGCSLTPYELY